MSNFAQYSEPQVLNTIIKFWRFCYIQKTGKATYIMKKKFISFRKLSVKLLSSPFVKSTTHKNPFPRRETLQNLWNQFRWKKLVVRVNSNEKALEFNFLLSKFQATIENIITQGTVVHNFPSLLSFLVIRNFIFIRIILYV